MVDFENKSFWETVSNSRSKIIKAGKIIRKEEASLSDKLSAKNVIDNWRAAHAYPLDNISKALRKIAINYNNVLVAERLKRLDSIITKLSLNPSMSLWEMQDLGGCRVIVNDLQSVYEIAKEFEQTCTQHIRRGNYDDYIKTPKKSGYRSLHAVYEHHCELEEFNRNMLIEIQFRTHLQHLWATAVESMGIVTKQLIKSGQGDDSIKRFFSLISSLFAIKENCAIVPGTSENYKELIAEIKSINDQHKYLELLSAFKVAVDYQSKKNHDSNRYCLLIINYEKRRLQVKIYEASQITNANRVYEQLERKNDPIIDTVLVRVGSFEQLKDAYPNYFFDITEFINLVSDEIKE